jgi:hypothetical protein
MLYSQGNLPPGGWLYYDISSFGSTPSSINKKIATIKYFPPQPQDGIGLSLMRSFGIPASTTRPNQDLNNGGDALCPPWTEFPYHHPGHFALSHTEDRDIIDNDSLSHTMREGKTYVLTSTIPEIDLNFFSKEVKYESGEAVMGTIYPQPDGGLFQSCPLVNDVIPV